MGQKAKDLTDVKFGELTAIKIVDSTPNGKVWECKCSCGNVVNVISTRLLSGKTKSCGHNQQHAYDNNLIKKKFGSDHWNYGKTGDLNATSKKVLCVTTGEIFGSAHDASRKYNLNFSNICSCCRGSRNYCGKLNDGTKLKWEYLKAD